MWATVIAAVLSFVTGIIGTVLYFFVKTKLQIYLLAPSEPNSHKYYDHHCVIYENTGSLTLSGWSKMYVAPNVEGFSENIRKKFANMTEETLEFSRRFRLTEKHNFQLEPGDKQIFPISSMIWHHLGLHQYAPLWIVLISEYSPECPLPFFLGFLCWLIRAKKLKKVNVFRTLYIPDCAEDYEGEWIVDKINVWTERFWHTWTQSEVAEIPESYRLGRENQYFDLWCSGRREKK